ncbi:pantoate--beta-alanine ligase [Gulosibacter macacae]|uniref:pantoate--beta-alanine ligase n=1 Tax=Gulosibacter macacae TaxID=2488791 RepID=UPI001F2C7EE2|nr:pantoate--beta-alanine ligase [Gulosibacter macacae]
MRILTTVNETRAALADRGRIALVPTMGALHDGHLSLVRLAKQHADTVIVSVFVNPLQFGPNEDFDRYPRPFDDDVKLLEQEGVDFCFNPTTEQMYPTWPSTTIVSAGEAGRILEGEFRPSHFDGVLTIVAKLFLITAPDFAVFGEKDAQQLALIRRMTRDLNIPVEIVGAPIVREPDGLARSSRNRYLEGETRERATVLNRALEAVEANAHEGAQAALAAGRKVYEADEATIVDYLVLVDAATFAPVDDAFTGDAIALTAARLGTTRLIDNRPVRVGGNEN